MMTDEQQTRAAELKAAIASTAASASGTAPEVRRAAVALKHEVRRVGMTAPELAAVLGIHPSTLCRWEGQKAAGGGVKATEAETSPKATTKAREGSAGFRVVEVATPSSSPTSTASGRPATAHPSSWPAASGAPGGSLRVAHAPSGLVIDGLDVDTLVALLRRLS